MMAALAGARLRLSRAYLAGGTDHDAADAEGGAGIVFGVLPRHVSLLVPPSRGRARLALGLATRN